MLLAEIPRVKAGTTAKGTKSLDEMDQERLYLATRAKDLLGYSALVGDVTGERAIGVKVGKLMDAHADGEYTDEIVVQKLKLMRNQLVTRMPEVEAKLLERGRR